MSDRRLLIRADASSEMGVGHVMRCIAVADAWLKTGGHVCFVMALGFKELGDSIHSTGSELIVNGCTAGTREDVDATVAAGKRFGADWMVLDGYHFSSSYIAAARAAAAHFLLMADGEQSPEFDCDLVVNPEPGISENNYRTRSHRGDVLLGPRYALLRSEFREYGRHIRAIPETAEHLLITLGGGDVDNITLRVLLALDQITDRRLDVTVVMGAANVHSVSLAAVATKSRHNVRLISNTQSMPELMSKADLAVAAGGGTSYELAFMRVPMVLIPIARNQEHSVNAYSQVGSAVAGCRFGELNEIKLADTLRVMIADSSLRHSLAENAAEMVDGNGAERIVERMLAISAPESRLIGTRG